MAALVLLGFGLASSAVLMAVGVWRAVSRRYRDRTGIELRGSPAVRAGLLVAAIGAGELAITLALYAAMR